MTDVQRSARKDVSRTLLNRLIVVGIGAVVSVLLARSLGATGRGEYAVAITFASVVVVIGHLSLEQAIVGSWADQGQRATIEATALRVGLIVGPLSAGLAIAVVPFVVARHEVSLARIAAIGAVPMILVLYVNAVAVVAAEVGVVNRARLVTAVVQLGLTIALMITGLLTVSGVVWIWIATPLVHLSVLCLGHSWQDRTRPAKSLPLVSLGMRYHIGNIAIFLLFRVDVLILNNYEDAGTVGLYALAVTLAELLYTVTDSISQVTQPSQLKGTPEEAALRTAQLVRATFIVAASAGLGLMLVARFIIPIVYGREFAGATPAVIILAPGVMALATAKPLGVLLMRQRRPWIVTGVNLSVLTVNVIANLLLIPVLGISGSALASTAAYVVQTGLFTLATRNVTGLRIGALVPRRADFKAVLGLRS